MACFSDLSFYIHHRIVYIILDQDFSNLYEWKQNISILGVCSLWRSIALPFVYSTVYVEDVAAYKEYRINGSVSKVTKRNLNLRLHKSSFLRSNISLIASSDLFFLVKRFKCVKTGNHTLHAYVTELVNLLKLDNTSWHNVEYLHLLMLSTPSNLLIGKHPNFGYNNKLVDILQFIGSNFTQVSSLFLHIDKRSTFSDKLFSGLINIFAHKLQVLQCQSSIPINYLYLSPQLTSLTISLQSINSNPPLLFVFGTTLKFLRIFHMPSKVDWGLFQDQNCHFDRNIWFHYLEFLLISFLDPESDYNTSYGHVNGLISRIHYKLHFPRLKRLIVRNIFKSTQLESANFTNNLTSIVLTGNPLFIKKYQVLKFINLKDILLIIHIKECSDLNQLYLLTDSISKNKYKCLNMLKISIIPSIISIDYTRINFYLITDLVFNCRIFFSDLRNIISSTKFLKELHLGKDAFYSLVETIYTLDISAYNHVSNANYSIERLIIPCCFDIHDQQKALLLIIYLLLCCRKLEYICVYELLRPEITLFIETYNDMYPHIVNPKIDYILLAQNFVPSDIDVSI